MKKSDVVFYYLQQLTLIVVMFLSLGYTWYYNNLWMLIFTGIVYISFNLLRIEYVLKKSEKGGVR